MTNEDIYQSKAYAGKNLLKEDVALRISETINWAGLYYDSIVFADTGTNIDGRKNEVKKYSKRALRADNKLVEQKWKELAEALTKEIENTPKVKYRKVNPTIYRHFLKSFYKLWTETRQNIGKKNWATIKKEDKLKEDNLKEAITNYFKEASEGNHKPRRLLILFEKYMESLTKCGILYFKYKSIKAGESWREGVG